jgi:hypothetical protein
MLSDDLSTEVFVFRDIDLIAVVEKLFFCFAPDLGQSVPKDHLSSITMEAILHQSSGLLVRITALFSFGCLLTLRISFNR